MTKLDAEKLIYKAAHEAGYESFEAYYNSSSREWEVSNHDDSKTISKIMTRKWHELNADNLDDN